MLRGRALGRSIDGLARPRRRLRHDRRVADARRLGVVGVAKAGYKQVPLTLKLPAFL